MTLLVQLEIYILQLEVKIEQLNQVNKGLQAQLDSFKEEEEEKPNN